MLPYVSERFQTEAGNMPKERQVGKVGILTSGGDCPGENAVIRAVVRTGTVDYGAEVIGIMRGWRGLMDGLTMPIQMDEVYDILPRGGTILRTSRTNPFAHKQGPQRILENMRKMGLGAVIAIGGLDSMCVAHQLFTEHGLNVVAVPKTIQNDVFGTEYALGFDTTVNTVVDAIDRIRTTAESHDRVMIVEVVGRRAGWIALHAGFASGADMIIIPEKAVRVGEVCDLICEQHDQGRDFSVVVIAEGVRLILRDGREVQALHEDERDEFGHPHMGGIGEILAEGVRAETDYETRVTVLGHIQRGGLPTASDRILGRRFGMAAASFVQEKRFGHMVALRGEAIVPVPLSEVSDRTRSVPESYYYLARPYFS